MQSRRYACENVTLIGGESRVDNQSVESALVVGAAASATCKSVPTHLHRRAAINWARARKHRRDTRRAVEAVRES